jgi:hypothetical protein
MRCVPTVFTKNRERLITHDALIELFNAELAIAQRKKSVSGEHFSVDSRLIQAWAGHKRFRAKDEQVHGSDEAQDTDDKYDHDDWDAGPGNFKGQRCSKDTHESSTDTDARLYRHGNTASQFRLMGHTLSDIRHGLIASTMVTTANGVPSQSPPRRWWSIPDRPLERSQQ